MTTRAERETAAVDRYLARHSLERAGRSYGNGAHYIRLPIPPADRNGRQRVTLYVRKIAKREAAPCGWCGSTAGTTYEHDASRTREGFDGLARCRDCGGS